MVELMEMLVGSFIPSSCMHSEMKKDCMHEF